MGFFSSGIFAGGGFSLWRGSAVRRASLRRLRFVGVVPHISLLCILLLRVRLLDFRPRLHLLHTPHGVLLDSVHIARLLSHTNHL